MTPAGSRVGIAKWLAATSKYITVAGCVRRIALGKKSQHAHAAQSKMTETAYSVLVLVGESPEKYANGVVFCMSQKAICGRTCLLGANNEYDCDRCKGTGLEPDITPDEFAYAIHGYEPESDPDV